MKNKSVRYLMCGVAMMCAVGFGGADGNVVEAAGTTVESTISDASRAASPEFNYSKLYMTRGFTRRLFLRNVKKGTKIKWSCSAKVKIKVDRSDPRFCEVRGLVPGGARVYATVNGKRIYTTITVFEKIENRTVRINKISSPKYNKVTINWNKIDGVTSYWIYYRKPGGKWRLVSKVGSRANTYTHISVPKKPITVGQKYQYTVVGYNKYTRKFSKYSVNGSGVMTKPTKSKVNEVGLTGNNKVVRVRWEYAAGCYYYRLYRNSGSGWAYLGYVPKTSRTYYDSTPVFGKTNRYAVVPYYGSLGNYSYGKVGVGVFVPKPVVKVNGVSLNRSNLTFSSKGESFDLKATVRPANATNPRVSYTTSDASVAMVSSSGVVTAGAEGSCTITVKTADGDYTDSCRVVVKYPEPEVIHVESVSLSSKSLRFEEKGRTVSLSATVLPMDAENRSVVWSSSNSSVARVDSLGNVTSVSNGTCIITVRSLDGSKVDTCTVTVDAPLTRYTYKFSSEFDYKDFYEGGIVTFEGGSGTSINILTQNPDKSKIKVVTSNNCIRTSIFSKSSGGGYTVDIEGLYAGECGIRVYCEDVLMFDEKCRVTSTSQSWVRFENWKRGVIADMGSSWSSVDPINKVINFGQYILDHYDYSASSEDSFETTGKGNCYMSASTLYLVAQDLGLEAEVVVPSWAGGNTSHVACRVVYGGKSYVIDAGFSGVAPRGDIMMAVYEAGVVAWS